MSKKDKIEAGVQWKLNVPYVFSTFGEMVRFLRKQHGLTQEQLAKKMGTTQSVIARIENTKDFPSHQMIKRVAKAFGLAAEAPRLVDKK